MSDAPILVTGGSGFLGAHMVAALLREGHGVRTTVRSRKREAEVRAMLERSGVDVGDRLELVEADLTADDGWADAVAGCRFVHHVASPFPPKAPKDDDELIRPAREGTLRVLRAARDAGVERVVLTSSFAAIGYGYKKLPERFDETCWSDTDGEMTAYARSKTLAEKAAWDFVDETGEESGPELAVVNPVAIFGPLLGKGLSTSITLVKRIVEGMPGCPRLFYGVVDVRDVVDLHLKAMVHPDAAGERFLAVSGASMSIQQMAVALKDHLGEERGGRIRTRQLPDLMVRLASLFDPAIRQTLPELGKVKRMSNEKAIRVLGWEPRSAPEALAATADSLFDLGLI